MLGLTIRCTEGDVTITPARSPWDNGSLHFLDGADSSERPEIGICQPGKLLLYRFQKVPCVCKTCIGAVVLFRVEPHGSAIGATSFRFLVVGS